MKCPNCNQTIKFKDSTCPYCGYARNDNFSRKEETENKVVETTYTKNENYEDWINQRIKQVNKANIIGCIVGIICSIVIIAFGIKSAFRKTEASSEDSGVAILLGFVILAFSIFYFKKKLYAIKKYDKYTIMAYIIDRHYYIVVDNVEVVNKHIYKKGMGQDHIMLDCFIPGTTIKVEATYKSEIEIKIIENIVKQNDVNLSKEEEKEEKETNKFFNPETGRLECPKCHEFFDKDDYLCLECGYVLKDITKENEKLTDLDLIPGRENKQWLEKIIIEATKASALMALGSLRRRPLDDSIKPFVGYVVKEYGRSTIIAYRDKDYYKMVVDNVLIAIGQVYQNQTELVGIIPGSKVKVIATLKDFGQIEIIEGSN